MRKPRTTDLILDDLDVAVVHLGHEIEGLAVGGEHYTAATLAMRKREHDHLVRARNWIVGYVAAVREGREGD